MMFELPVRVYYEDTDAGGVVYHANYLKFFERSRTEFLRDLGFEQDQLLTKNIAFVVRHCELDFLKPARFNDQLLVSTAILKLKRASMVFEQQIVCQQGNLLCKATVVVVSVDIEHMKPIAIPENILKELKSVC